MKCQRNKSCRAVATCQIGELLVCPACFGEILLKKLLDLGGKIPYHNTFKAREEKRIEENRLIEMNRLDVTEGTAP
jgi:hypothetical protein